MPKKHFPEGSTGSTDLIALLRGVVEKLNHQPDVVKGGLYHTLSGAMQDRITTFGVVNVSGFVLLMQELGLLRHRGAAKAVVWQVICLTFFDEVVSQAWLDRAQARLVKHVEMTETLRVLRERVAELEKKDVPTKAVGVKSVDEIAEMVVAIERLQEKNVEQGRRIVELEAVIASHENVDHDAALAAAIKRARERLS